MLRNKRMIGYFLLMTAPMLFAFQNCAGNYQLTTAGSLNGAKVEPQGAPSNGQCIPGTDTICPGPSPTPSSSPTPDVSPTPQPSPTPSVSPSPDPSPSPGGDGTCSVPTNIGTDRDVGFGDVDDSDFQRECGHNNHQGQSHQLVPKKCAVGNDNNQDHNEQGEDSCAGEGSGDDICVTQHGCDLINEYMNDTDGILMNKPHHLPGTDNGQGNNGQDEGWHCLIHGNCAHQHTHFHKSHCDGRRHVTDAEIVDAINKLRGYWSNH